MSKSSATGKSRQRKPVERKLALLNLPTDEFWGALILTVNGEAEGYAIKQIPADFGIAWEVYKAREQKTYHVHAEGADFTCDCPGGTYRGKCKHQDAVRKLISLGKLQAPPCRKAEHTSDVSEFDAA